MKIAFRTRIFALGLVLTTALCIGMGVYWGYNALIASQQRENLERQVRTEALRLEYAFNEIKHDIELLAGLPSIAGIVALHAGPRRIASPEGRQYKDDLAVVFTEMLRAKVNYDQIRLIGTAGGGFEIVRVDRSGETPGRTPEEELQRKGERPYFKRTIHQPPGRLYFSEVNLNREEGRIEAPHRPMLRAAQAVYAPSGQPFGIVIINLNFSAFVDELLAYDRSRYAYYVVNDRGDYLVHPEAERTFGFDLGKRFRVQDEFEGSESLFEGPSEGFTLREQGGASATRRLVHFRKVHIFPDDSTRYLGIGIAATYGDVSRQATTVGTRALVITMGLLVLALGGALLLAARLTRPLQRITRAAERYAEHGILDPLPGDSRDEIGTLARAFETMVADLKDQENRIVDANERLRSANEDLEHFSHIASHDLREPVRLIIGLADFVRAEERERVSPAGREVLVRMQKEALKILDQITDFRVLARIGTGTLLRKKTNMVALVESVLTEYEAALAARRATVSVVELPTLNVYENLAVVLYRHLVDNALQHTREKEFSLTFTAEHVGEQWILGVKNTGSSIEQGKLDQVFSPFTRLRGDQPGTGMGLSICKRIVERHAGRIWIEADQSHVHVKFDLGNDGYHDSGHEPDHHS